MTTTWRKRIIASKSPTPEESPNALKTAPIPIAITDDQTVPKKVQFKNCGLNWAGTPSFGGRRNKSHAVCRRCCSRAYHTQKGRCASCGYPGARLRSSAWAKKAHAKQTQGAGRTALLKGAIAKLAAVYAPKA
jgi:large subunit ribosomal protein L37e